MIVYALKLLTDLPPESDEECIECGRLNDGDDSSAEYRGFYATNDEAEAAGEAWMATVESDGGCSWEIIQIEAAALLPALSVP